MNPNQRPPQRPTNPQLGYMTPQQYASALQSYMSYVALTQDQQAQAVQHAQLQQLQQNLGGQMRPGLFPPGFPGSVASTPIARASRPVVPSSVMPSAIRPLQHAVSAKPSPPSNLSFKI